jgi:hypothetical protein
MEKRERDKFSLLSQLTTHSSQSRSDKLRTPSRSRTFPQTLLSFNHDVLFSINASRFFLVLAASVNAMASAQECSITIGRAGDYVVLANTGISTVAPSHVTGDIGVSPITATAMNGFGLVLEESG